MLFIFKNILREYRLDKAMRHCYKLIADGKKEEAFNEFNSLLAKDPYRVYLRFQVLRLGEELNKEVVLPDFKVSNSNKPTI